MRRNIWQQNPKEKRCLVDVNIEMRIILEWILKNKMGGFGLDLSGSGSGKEWSFTNRKITLGIA
jgi:hypothetical protein